MYLFILAYILIYLSLFILSYLMYLTNSYLIFSQHVNVKHLDWHLITLKCATLRNRIIIIKTAGDAKHSPTITTDMYGR